MMVRNSRFEQLIFEMKKILTVDLSPFLTMKWSDMAIDFYKSRAVVYIYCRERPGVALIYLCEQYY